MSAQPLYPHQDGDFTVIGPECFTDGSVICYRGENYTLRPRTITTEEEVELLPEGTKLYSPGTTHSWALNDLSQRGGVKVHGTGGGYTYLGDFIRQQAPLTVLYSPEES
jgi:hypothetical protein